MAIENLRGKTSRPEPMILMLDKINEIIDYLNSQDTKVIIRIKDNGSTRDSTWTSKFNPDDVATATEPGARCYRVSMKNIEQQNKAVVCMEIKENKGKYEEVLIIEPNGDLFCVGMPAGNIFDVFSKAEPSKTELVPLDVDNVLSEIDDVVQLHEEADQPNRVRNILSKYGVPRKITPSQVLIWAANNDTRFPICNVLNNMLMDFRLL